MAGGSDHYRGSFALDGRHASPRSPTSSIDSRNDDRLLDMSASEFLLWQQNQKTKRVLQEARQPQRAQSSRRGSLRDQAPWKEAYERFSGFDRGSGRDEFRGQSPFSNRGRTGYYEDHGYALEHGLHGQRSSNLYHSRGRSREFSPGDFGNPADEYAQHRLGRRHAPACDRDEHHERDARSRSRSVEPSRRVREASRTRKAIFEAPRVQAAMKKATSNHPQNDAVPDEDVPGGKVAPDLSSAGTAKSGKRKRGGGAKSQTANLASDGGPHGIHLHGDGVDTSNTSSPTTDHMPYLVPPLLQASSFGASTTTKRRKIKSASSVAAHRRFTKELCVSGLGGVKSAHPTSLGSQSSKASDNGSEASSSSSGLFVSEHSGGSVSSASMRSCKKEGHASVRSGVDNYKSPDADSTLASYTPFSQTFEKEQSSQGTAAANISEEEMMDVQARFEEKKREAAERRRLAGVSPTQELSLQEQLRDISKQVEAHGINRIPKVQEDRTGGRDDDRYATKKEERKPKTDEEKRADIRRRKEERAAERREQQRRQAEAYEKLGKQEARTQKTQADTPRHAGGQSKTSIAHGPRHLIKNRQALSVERQRPSPQHGTPPPRLATKQIETISISSEESSSDEESDEESDHDSMHYVLSGSSTGPDSKPSPFEQGRQPQANGVGPSMKLKSNLKLPTPGTIASAKSKKVRIITPSEERAEMASAAAKHPLQTNDDPHPAKKARLGGTLSLGNTFLHNAISDVSAAVPAYEQTTVPTSGPLSPKQKLSDPRDSVHIHNLFRENGELRRDSVVKSHVPSTGFHSDSSDDQPSSSEAGSSSSGDQPANRSKDESDAAERRKRERLEREAFKRWEKKAAELRAKGEEPKPFVYKPQAPRKKKEAVPDGAESTPSARAAKEEKKKQREKKAKGNPVFAGIKRDVHQAAIRRQSLFGAPDLFGESPAHSPMPLHLEDQNVNMHDMHPVVSQATKNTEGGNDDEDDELDALFEGAWDDEPMFVGDDDQSSQSTSANSLLDASAPATSFSTANGIEAVDASPPATAVMDDEFAPPSFDLDDMELDGPDILDSHLSSIEDLNASDLSHASSVQPAESGAAADPFHDLFSGSSSEIMELQGSASTPGAEATSATKSNVRHLHGNMAQGSEPALSTAATQDGPSSPQQGFLAQLALTDANAIMHKKPKPKEPDVIDFSAEETSPRPSPESLDTATEPKMSLAAQSQREEIVRRDGTCPPSDTTAQSKTGHKGHSPQSGSTTAPACQVASKATIANNGQIDVVQKLRNGQPLPDMKHFEKLDLTHWAWEVAKTFLETGRATPRDIESLRSSKQILETMLMRKASQSIHDPQSGAASIEKEKKKPRKAQTTSARTQPTAKQPVPMMQDRMLDQEASESSNSSTISQPAQSKAKKASKARKSAPRDERDKSRGHASTSRLAPSNKTKNAQPHPSNSLNSEGPESSQSTARKRPAATPAAPKRPLAHESSEVEDPRRQLAEHPKFGGKQLNPQMMQYLVESRDQADSDDETVEQPHDEYCRREPSPITERDELHYQYAVKRKQWMQGEYESNAKWFTVQNPVYYSREDAIAAASAETMIVRDGIAWNPITGRRSTTNTDLDGIWDWYGELSRCFIRIKVDQVLHSPGDGVLPKSKKFHLPQNGYWINKEVWKRTQKVSLVTALIEKYPSQLSADDDDNDHEDSDLDSLPPEHDEVAETSEERPAETEAENEDDFDLELIYTEVLRRHYTVLDQANKDAGQALLDEAHPPDSQRMDDVQARSKRSMEIADWRKATAAERRCIDIEAVVKDGTEKVRYWVEEVEVVGPKN